MHMDRYSGDRVDGVAHRHTGVHDLRSGEEDREGRGQAGGVVAAGWASHQGERARFCRAGLPPESVYRKIVGIPTISRIRYFYQVVVVRTIYSSCKG